MQKSIPSKLIPNTQQSPQFYYTQPNPPPKQQIIASKDHAIQQLIIQNTHLKKQLSQLMLKTSVPHTPIQSAVQSPRQSIRPNMGQLNNSVRNSFNNTCTANNFHNTSNNFQNTSNNFQKYSTNTSFNQPNKHLMMQSSSNQVHSRHGRSYRHSVDMCSNLEQGYTYVPYQPVMINPQSYQIQRHNNNNVSQTFQPKINNNTIIIPQVKIQALNKMRDNTKHQDQIIQCQLYRQKMMKLKGKKSPRSRQISQQKSYQVPKPNIIINKIENTKNNSSINTRKQQLLKAHETLKSKLNSSNQTKTKIITKNKLQVQKPQTVQIQIKTPIKKLLATSQKIISAEDIKLINDVKKLPKYVPKTFSKQKQNKQHLPFVQEENKQKTTVSNKNIQKKQQENNVTTVRQKTQTKQILKQKQKKIGLRQLKGRVYLDDENDQKLKTKRTISKNINLNTNKNDTIQKQSHENNNKQLKKQPQVTMNRAKTVQTQLTNQRSDSIKRLSTDDSVSNIQKVLMRKNSNKVYLQEDTQDHSNKTFPKQIVPKDIVKPKKNSMSKQKSNEIVSIEEIHMIGDQDNNQPIVAKNINKNTYKSQKEKPQLIMTTQSPINTVLKSPSQRKQLYNHVYCSQQSKTKFK